MNESSSIIKQGKVQFPFQNGYHGSGIGWKNESPSLIKLFHFWVNFAMWGILVDLGNCAARFFKTKKYYIQIHGYIMLLVCTTTFIVEMIVLVKNPKIFIRYSTLSQIQILHFLLGFIFMILFILQVIGGYVLYLIFSREQFKMNKYSYYYKLFHQIFGYMLYFAGKAGVLTGFILIEDQYVIITSKGIIKLYNNMILVLYDNKIYDIAKVNHPGGNFLMMQIKGREIGRFMYGAFGLETTNIISLKKDFLNIFMRMLTNFIQEDL
ncbi:hypothetical protein IMG5_176050, partial [Ichthyophthirius multifiliis]